MSTVSKIVLALILSIAAAAAVIFGFNRMHVVKETEVTEAVEEVLVTEEPAPESN